MEGMTTVPPFCGNCNSSGSQEDSQDMRRVADMPFQDSEFRAPGCLEINEIDQGCSQNNAERFLNKSVECHIQNE